MNILEALKAAEEGSFIRCDVGGTIYYVIQTTLSPFGDKNLVRLDLNDISNNEQMPTQFSDLDYGELEEVCLDALISENYSIVSEAEILREIQASWKKENP